MGVVSRVDAFQRRHPVAAYPLGVLYKFLDDRGPHLAALMTFYGVLSLFPLLLLATSVLGFTLSGDPELQRRILSVALSGFDPLTDQLETSVHPLRGSGPALVVGAVGTVYGGLGVMQATQAALNRIYAVPRFAQPNPVRSRVRSAALLVLLGAAAIVSAVASVLVARIGTVLPDDGRWLGWTAGGLSAVVNVGIFLVVFQLLTARRLGWRDVALGAVVAAALWQLLQVAGPLYAERYLPQAGAVYGTFGLVLGLIVWVYLQALVVVLAAEVNVVRQQRLYPRALLTPFRDDVDLTPQDEAVYAGYARSERYKAFEHVTTTFERGDGAPPHDRGTFPATGGAVPVVAHGRRSAVREDPQPAHDPQDVAAP